ncbi:hypothetical protein BS17DRAFT_768873 [Gyrodon lividus]|nr:hypothetical protein BS17DRAFT_768873 [Gyrodon lividus]
MKTSTILGFLSLALPFAIASPFARRHHEVANRARADVDIHQRSFTGARFTFYDVGLGACGIWNGRNDLIVALNVNQFGPGYPGQYCFKTITISYGGKTTQAIITDKVQWPVEFLSRMQCMGCPWGGLDFSRGLFDFFASEDIGVLYGDWWFDDDSDDSDDNSGTANKLRSPISNVQ